MAASSSSSAVNSSFGSSSKYQVFLSFRGDDTRKGFTGYLYTALENAGIHTFMDDEKINFGEKFGEEILKAIAVSRYYVVILSKRYADSKWCLRELKAMVDHMTESAAMSSQHKKEIIPVFYYVEPSHVRHQEGPFKQSFKHHEAQYPVDVEGWRQAMTEVGARQGPVIKHESNKKEVELIQEIVEIVGGCSDNVVLPVAEHPVGIDSRVEEVMELLSIKEGGVKMVGIYGMGGVGKTTIAKAIHNRLQGRFDKAIYIEGIKDKKDRLPELQEEFISEAFKEGNKKIRNTSQGSAEIKKRFPHKRVLVVLDDVDDVRQLKALAGGCDWFGEGSRVLITTRDELLLDVHRHVAKKYQVHELNSRESLHLFSRHAVNRDQPSEEFMEISNKIVNATGGLPLALEVLGASLSTETDIDAWEEVETKLRSSKYSKIDNCLRISYDGLSQSEQEGFLDIACFFVGQEKDEVIDIWKGCGFGDPVSTVNSLLHKCLVKVDDSGRLRMHDLLRDMGRVTGSNSRLWDQKEVWEVLKEHKGTDKIKGIICEGYLKGKGDGVIRSFIRPEQERASLDVEVFANMSNLQLLLLENINLKGDFSRMPRSLRSLTWTDCSMQTLPDNFHIEKLGCLKSDSRDIVRLWSDSCISKKKVFANLKVLDLWDCSALTKLPDFSHTLELEKLYLRRCYSLTDIPESIGKLTRLKRLRIEHCSSLSTLPDSIGNLTELRRLYLSNFESLSALPDSIGRLTLLVELQLIFCTSLSALPISIERLSLLKELILIYCTSLSTLPDSIGNLTELRRLELRDCESLSALPHSIGRLTLLEKLNLFRCTSMSTLPSSIGHMSRLSTLVLSLSGIEELPDSVRLLESLEWLLLLGCRLRSRLPLWEMKCLQGLVIGGGDIDSNDGDQNSEVYEIPEGITHYSRHTQECRRIRYLHTSGEPRDDESYKKFELSIWVVSGRERKIILLVYPLMKWSSRRMEYWNFPWLKHIFPDDFTPVDDTEALHAYANSSPAPDISKKQMEDLSRHLCTLM